MGWQFLRNVGGERERKEVPAGARASGDKFPDSAKLVKKM